MEKNAENVQTRQPEDPLLAEVVEPLSSERCGECLFQGGCLCSTTKIVNGRTVHQREKILPLLGRAASIGGKKSVRAQAAMHDSDVLEHVLSNDAYGLPNVEVAACINGQHQAGIVHAVESVLHERRSGEQRVVHSNGKVHVDAHAVTPKVDRPAIEKSVIPEDESFVPPEPFTWWQRLARSYGIKL